MKLEKSSTEHEGKLRIATTSDGVNTSMLYRESESDVKVDPIVKWIWFKVCITTLITISITNLITIVA